MRPAIEPDNGVRFDMPRVLKIAGGLLAFLALFLAGAFGFLTYEIANPAAQDLSLHADLIALETDEGQALRDQAVHRADLGSLEEHFESQRYATYCGVASSVIALNALGTPVTQDTFFDGPASAVHGGWSTFYGGMTLEQLGGLITAHGARVEVVHAGDTTVEGFRQAARANLGRTDDVVLINYLRAAIEQASGGHISPLGAYDEVTDRFLVLDVSTYKYPHVWVKTDALFGALNTVDSSSGKTRGYVLVGN